MSQKNVEMVRRAIEAVNRGDVASALSETSDEFEMDWSNSIGPLRGVYRGRGQVTNFIEAFFEAWADLEWDMREVVDVGREQVLVVNRLRMRGRSSGAVVEAMGAQIWTIRDGMLRRAKVFQSKAEALKALGLSEQDAHADSHE
jgi:ketosteroid isomerase-like protein